MDYDKLIEHLRECGTYGFKQEECRDAALAIETLRADLARVTAERDAAVDADKAILWLKDYVFEDSRKIYTNGVRLIPYFRVLQALRDKAYNGLREG